MEKRYALLRRRPDIKESEFRSKWLAAGRHFQGSGACLQNHLQGVDQRDPTWSGIGEFDPEAEVAWLANADFADHAKSVLVTGSTFVVNDRPQTGVKYLTLTRRSPSFGRREFAEYWRHSHVEMLRRLPEFWGRLGRYVQHLLEPDSARSLADAPISFDYDGLAELWFDSEASAAEAVADPSTAAAIKQDDRHFLLLPYERYISEQVLIGPFRLP